MATSAHAQIGNGTFETGAFAPWVQFGDLGFTSVATAGAHTGTYGGRFGPLTPGGINQVVPAAANDSVTVSFWLNAGGSGTTFTVTLGGTQLDSIPDAPATWTFHTYTINAPSANPLLEFTFTNPPSWTNLDDVSAIAGVQSACCLPDGTCTMTNSTGCTAAQGQFHDGQNCGQVSCPPPPSGRCCALDGTCTTSTQATCLATAGSVWGGANTTCGTCPQPWHETTDAGELIADAQAVTGSGPVSAIFGHTDGTDSDMYKIHVCDHANFGANTTAAGTGNTLDTQLFLFNTAGIGVVMDDDSSAGVGGSVLTGQFVATDGDYYLAYSLYNRDPVDSAAALIWNNQNNGAAYFPEWQPNGPAAANAIAAWTGTSGLTGDYTIALKGVCFIGTTGGCYANCDGSTGNPQLNANDFQCFLNAYAIASSLPNDQQITSYANCDQSTGNPALNANDFQCFLNTYAIGCT
jgi:hypothetical protein